MPIIISPDCGLWPKAQTPPERASLDTSLPLGVGEVAEVIGKQGLEVDRFARLLKYRGDRGNAACGPNKDSGNRTTALP
jgi:hypothetical protein